MGDSAPPLRTLVLALLTCSVIVYALYDELRAPRPLDASVSTDGEADIDPTKLRIVSVHPAQAPPGAAVYVQLAGADPDHLDDLAAQQGKEALPVLRRRRDQLLLRLPSQLPYGQIKLRVLQGERRSKPWVMTLTPLPRSRMLRYGLGGLALFALGLRTVGRALRAYAGKRVRAQLGDMTRAPGLAMLWGALGGIFTQGATASSALLAGLMDARMLGVRRAGFLLIGSQLGAALAAVLLPLFALREALWIIVIGVLWVFLAPSRLSRALGSAVMGAGLIFHGLALLQDGCAPLVSDPLLLPYLWHLHAGGIKGVLLSSLAGAGLVALLQSPAPVFALIVSLLQQEVLGLREALAMLGGVSLGGIVNTGAATWAFRLEARRLLRVQFIAGPVGTAAALLGLPLWEHVCHASASSLGAGFTYLNAAQLQLGAGFIALSAVSQLTTGLLLWLGRKPWMTGQPRVSAAPPVPTLLSYTQALSRALEHCRRGLRGVRDIIASGDRSSAPETEAAITQAQLLLRGLLRSPALEASGGLQAAGAAALHLADTLLSTLGIAEKAPELGLVPSGEAAQALEQLHGLLDGALNTLCSQLDAGHFPSLEEAQAREIEINAAEAESRRRLFASQSSGDELALRLWSSELCSAYESIGNQVYRAVSAVAAEEDL